MKFSRLLFCALMAIVCLGACSDDARKKVEQPSAPVITAKAVERDVPVILRVIGRARAYESVIVRSRVDGQATSVLFTEGQHVKAGDVLIRLDPTDFSVRLQQAIAATARDAALVKRTRADTARYEALRDRNFVSDEKVNEVRTNEAVAVANLNASKASTELARLQLSYTTIRAPIAGVTGARLVFPGSSVRTNETDLVVVNRASPLLVSFALPERHLPKLREAMLNALNNSDKMKVHISLPGKDMPSLLGDIHFIDNTVDPTTGTIAMKAILPNTDGFLTPGQFLNVAIVLETLNKVVTVPNEAVQQGQTGNFTYVVKPDNTVEVRKIVTINAEDGWTAIREGLQAGEIVVIGGQLRMAPGVRVREVKRSNEDEHRAPSSG